MSVGCGDLLLVAIVAPALARKAAPLSPACSQGGDEATAEP